MWQKYYWKKNGKIVGLYSYKKEKEEYYFEIIFTGRILEDIIFMGSCVWDKKWQEYFRGLEMVSLTTTMELDELLWSYKK